MNAPFNYDYTRPQRLRLWQVLGLAAFCGWCGVAFVAACVAWLAGAV
jgi:hypothetical protein